MPMANSGLPYDMGNAGDLLKHGVVAELVRWRSELGQPVRFLDLFGGEPYEEVAPAIVKRVQALTGTTLREAQSEIGDGRCRYYGSGTLVRMMAERAGWEGVRVFTADRCTERRKRLRDSGLSMLNDAFPHCGAGTAPYDAYAAFEEIVREAEETDLVLLDPFASFLRHKARSVIPQMRKMISGRTGRGAVVLFALNLNPDNCVGKRFDALLKEHLKGAWRMKCPPLSGTGIRGEGKHRAEVILAARFLLEHESGCRDVAALWRRLNDLGETLSGVLHLSGQKARMLKPEVIGGHEDDNDQGSEPGTGHRPEQRT